MRVASAIVMLSLAAASASAQTLPLATEQASTAAAGTLVGETGAAWVHAEPSFLTGKERNRYDAPLLRLVYSPAGNVELDLEWIARVGATGDPILGSVSDWGDVSLRAKWRFQEERPGRPTLAARFGVTLPETRADQGLGPNTLRMSAQLLASKSVGARTTLHANAGLALQDHPFEGPAQSDFLHYGAAICVRAAAHTELVAEIAGLAGHGAPGSEQRSELRAGVRYTKGHVRYSGALRRGLAAADGSWGFLVGLAWTVRGG